MQKYILGVEIGGTKLQLALGNLQGDLVDVIQGKVIPEKGAAGIRSWIKGNLPTLVSKAKRERGEVIRIGCGFGGPLDSHQGKILTSVHIPGWKGFPLKDWFEDTFGIPTTVANDSNAAAWGEYLRGVGQGSQYFFYTNIGTGVGGGLVLDGALYDGQGYGAGEFGHSYVPDWTVDQPGQPEKVENLCSGWSIEKRLRQEGYVAEDSVLYEMCNGDLDALTAISLSEAAQSGDTFALKEIDKVAYSMSLGLVNILCFLNVEIIAIGGGVSNMGELLLEPIRKYTKQFEFISSAGHYLIKKCALGKDIVLVGAILLAKEELT